MIHNAGDLSLPCSAMGTTPTVDARDHNSYSAVYLIVDIATR